MDLWKDKTDLPNSYSSGVGCVTTFHLSVLSKIVITNHIKSKGWNACNSEEFTILNKYSFLAHKNDYH